MRSIVDMPLVRGSASKPEAVDIGFAPPANARMICNEPEALGPKSIQGVANDNCADAAPAAGDCFDRQRSVRGQWPEDISYSGK
jgi:hypothetical protein